MRLCASIFTKTKMYYLQNKKLLIILSIWYNYLIALNEAFELTDVTPTTRIEVKEGEPITLSCSTSDHYEWCKFIHKEHGKECDFVWTRQAWNITTLNCTDYENRAFYTGDYDNNICAITIISTTIEDTGDWLCELEEYWRGYERGDGKNVTGKMSVQIIPKITTTLKPFSSSNNDESLTNNISASDLEKLEENQMKIIIAFLVIILFVSSTSFIIFIILRNKRQTVLFEILHPSFSTLKSFPKSENNRPQLM